MGSFIDNYRIKGLITGVNQAEDPFSNGFSYLAFDFGGTGSKRTVLPGQVVISNMRHSKKHI